MEEKRRYKVWLYICALFLYLVGVALSNFGLFPAPIPFIGESFEIIAFYFFLAKGISILTGILTKSKVAQTLSVISTVFVIVLRIFQAVTPEFSTETYFLFILPVYLPLIFAIWFTFWADSEEAEEKEPKKKIDS